MMLGLWGYGLDGLVHSLTDTDELASTVVAWLLFAGPPFFGADALPTSVVPRGPLIVTEPIRPPLVRQSIREESG